MIPVRCRMLDPFITLAAWFQANQQTSPMTSAYPRSLCTVWEQTCSPSPDLNRTARHLKGIETGLLLEDKKPLERTPHFFEPVVGECVNASGYLVDGVRVELTFYDMMSCTP